MRGLRGKKEFCMLEELKNFQRGWMWGGKARGMEGTVEMNPAITWWLTDTSHITQLHRPASSFPQTQPILVSGTALHKSRGCICFFTFSGLHIHSCGHSCWLHSRIRLSDYVTAAVIHGPSCHLRGPSLLPFPVGSKFPLASKVLSWFPSQAFAVLLPLMVPRLTPSSLRSHLSSRFLWEISSSHLQSQLLIFSAALAYLPLIVLVRNGYHLTSLPVNFLSFTWR